MNDAQSSDPMNPAKEEESFETLLAHSTFRVVRIVSRGHVSPPAFWYDQNEHEWILLVSGEAELEIEGEGITTLEPGDTLLLRAHQRHRVIHTSKEEPTIWLALFFDGVIAAPLPATDVRRIVEHMNDDHADSLLDYARTFGDRPDAEKALLTGVDSHGMNVEARTPAGPAQLRIPFEGPIGDAGEARKTLVAMAQEAQRRLASSEE